MPTSLLALALSVMCGLLIGFLLFVGLVLVCDCFSLFRDIDPENADEF